MQFLRLSYLAFFGFIVLGVTAMPKPTPAPVAVDLAFGDQMDARLSLLMSPVAWAKPVQLATGSTPIEYTFPFIFGDRALSLNAGPGRTERGTEKSWQSGRPQRVDNARAVADGRPGSLEAGRRDPPPITEQASDQVGT
ncbi:hypothetical protein POSPLADRAFT_1045017 [Postia placenta MAD-698-R-SB12]|uniref:Uncharacterized protein n=1 Tax=Postia placenta MAD-698-R-SB12 TaxID=670580 RepID=A0A1X6N5F5_9APHY|nr:hypothetical protein POSPLADRAFT_1045017 [Postia placenta MAD-698-R-SB12]OSX63838.1 hypothetical protein POSPLADRAFT_1045017 [Postia placenta MAD-698-R-SB12]